MKLDRNNNPDGHGKYALVNLRLLNSPECLEEYRQWYENLKAVGLINAGASPGEQFFVMKYKDCFTAQGLRGYAQAVRQLLRYLGALGEPSTRPSDLAEQIRNLEEYAAEMEAQADLAVEVGKRIPD